MCSSGNFLVMHILIKKILASEFSSEVVYA